MAGKTAGNGKPNAFDLFGMNVINKDCIAIARVVYEAVEAKSAFMLKVAETMALVKLGQETAGVSYNVRMYVTGETSDSDLSSLREAAGLVDADSTEAGTSI